MQVFVNSPYRLSNFRPDHHLPFVKGECNHSANNTSTQRGIRYTYGMLAIVSAQIKSPTLSVWAYIK